MRGFRMLPLVSALALFCIGTQPPGPAGSAGCQSISDAVAALEARVAKLETAGPGPFGHPGEPLKPQGKPLTAQQKALLKALQAQLDILQAQLAACQAPPATPPLTVPATTAAGIRVPDPQIAVGRKYLAAIDTSTIVFYDKATMQPLKAGTEFAYAANPIGASTLFKSFFPVIDAQMKLPANVCDSTKPGWDKSFDPAQPNKVIPGCIDAAYDTRVLYDSPGERFWIESAVRNPLWPCKQPPGADIGGFTKSDHVTLIDPSPNNPKLVKCHPGWSASWAHRFIAIAVSRVGADARDRDRDEPMSPRGGPAGMTLQELGVVRTGIDQRGVGGLRETADIGARRLLTGPERISDRRFDPEALAGRVVEDAGVVRGVDAAGYHLVRLCRVERLVPARLRRIAHVRGKLHLGVDHREERLEQRAGADRIGGVRELGAGL